MIRPEILVLCGVIGLATYLIRFVPFLVAQRLKDREDEAPQGSPASDSRSLRMLGLIGPSIVAALLVTSILPQPGEAEFGLQLARSLLALTPALVSAVLWRNLGLTVVVGISSYWLISSLL